MSSNESPDNYERTDLGFTINQWISTINVTVTARSRDQTAFFLYVGDHQESRADFKLGFLNKPVTPSKLNVTGDGLTLTAVGPLAKSPVIISIRYTTLYFGPAFVIKTLVNHLSFFMMIASTHSRTSSTLRDWRRETTSLPPTTVEALTSPSLTLGPLGPTNIQAPYSSSEG